MFKIVQSNTFVWPVKVELPSSGGKFDTQTFDAEFKRLPQSQVEELIAKVDDDSMKAIEFCKQVLVGWKGVVDDSGQEVPFSESSRDQLLEVQVVAGSLVKSFLNAISGGKIKN